MTPPTPDETPGAALDAIVAKAVGWTDQTEFVGMQGIWMRDPQGVVFPVPEFSTDTSDAMTLLEDLPDDWWRIEFNQGRYRVSLSQSDAAIAPTLPHAIALAVLKSKGGSHV